jgi:membrane peptidoglycan carboxypeptidase
VGTVYGGTLPAQIWHGFMEGALSHTPAHDWPKPKNPPHYIPNFSSEFTQRAVVVLPPATTDKKKKKSGTGDKSHGGGAAGGKGDGGGNGN